MPKYGYLVVEGPHDVWFTYRLLSPFGLTLVRMKGDLNPFWEDLVPKDFPPNGDLHMRVPVPLFLQSDSHSIAVHNAIGDARLVETVEENAALINVAEVTGIGLMLDSDQSIAAADRFEAIKKGLEGKGFTLPDNPGEVAAGVPQTGAFVLPDNSNPGTLEDLLIECATQVYPNLLHSASAHADTVAGDANLNADDRADFNKPAGRNKAIVGSIASVLRPGKAVQVSIQDNRWLKGANLNLAHQSCSRFSSCTSGIEIMEASLKRVLKAVTLELRHLLEGRYDSDGKWKPGDLEQRLAAIGVRRDRASVPVDELRHLAEEDRQARKVVDAYLKLREEAGVERSDAVADFVRETAYTWANRLLALRCMEARELIDSVILQQEAYGGRSLEHHRVAQRHPELCAGDDDGLFAVLEKVFRQQSERLPMLFDPQAPGIALRPSPVALKDCFGLLSLNPGALRKYRIRPKEDEAADARTEPPNPFTAPDALGWAYQYWNTEEKNRVFERVRTVKGTKIAGSDIIPATQLYTEDYMVKFLVQNSLGATWMAMHTASKLAENWEYYVRDADRGPVGKKPVREITFLDPACGSGHFLLEAFDLFYAMYQEEGELNAPGEICDAILTKNLFGIDIDARAVQIAEVALWMKAAERAFDYKGVPTNLLAATASHLKGEAWEEFLATFEREPSVARVLRKFAQTMEHIDEIGSLARPAEDLRDIIRQEHATWERQVRERKEANYLFPEIRAEARKRPVALPRNLRRQLRRPTVLPRPRRYRRLYSARSRFGRVR